MNPDSLVRLIVPLQKTSDPFQIIEDMVDGKDVLNVGAAGGVYGYLPDNRKIWLHEKLRKKANSIIGVDIDAAAIKYADEHGYKIQNKNCETMKLGQKFDVIVMSDVIEHVNAPVTAINNLVEHLSENGRLVITTPNATAGNICIRALLRKKINVLGDHMAIYYPEHFQAICYRLGYSLESVYLFDHIDRRSFVLRFKSFLFVILTAISPQLASSMMITIQKI